MGIHVIKTVTYIVVLFLCLLSLQARAEFVLDFAPDDPTANAMTTNITGHAGQTSITGQTPFLMNSGGVQPEVVTDPDNGNTYLHLIVGSLSDGFIQETYIQTTEWADCYYNGSQGCSTSVPRGAFDGDTGKTNSTVNTNTPASSNTWQGNALNPLSSDAGYTGNGSANPTKVIMRQIVNDGEIYMEFLKDKYDRKPAAAQAINAPDISATFVVDMRNSTYADINTPGVVTNTMALQGADLPDDKAQFNMATDAQYSFSTAGRYTYTDGTGFGGSAGTYSYLDGDGFKKEQVNWDVFFDPLDPTNIWSFSGNEPN